METQILTKELILNVCNQYIARSRYFDSTFIHRLTGQKMTLRQTATFIGLTVQSYCITTLNKRLAQSGPKHENHVLLEALKELDYLNEDNCKDITDVYKPWAFFDEYFCGSAGENILCSEMQKKYQILVGEMPSKAFYQDLKQWAAEHQYKLTFKNVLKNRKVILEI